MALELDDVLRVTASFLQDGINQVQNVFTVKIGSTSGTPTQAQVITDIKEYIQNVYADAQTVMNNTIATDFISIYNITKDVLEHIGPWISDFSGSSTGDAMPNGVSPFMYARTIIKRRRGSKFLPASAESTQGNGILSSGAIAALTNTVTDWISDHTGGLTSWIFSPGIYSDVPGLGLTFLFFVNGVLRAQLGYQRRRKPGVGA